MIDKIFSREELRKNPPVLLDIGASGGINPKWKSIARYSICLAFEPDNRELSFSPKKHSEFKRFILINRVVTDSTGEEVGFYLTESPYCSSTLPPDAESLSFWHFRDLFEVKEKCFLKSANLQNIFRETNINKIDWFKADTQGTDLRLFKSIPPELKKHVLAAEFEPGIIDAYKGEDKLFSVLEHMHTESYYMSSFEVMGAYRIEPSLIQTLPSFYQRVILRCSRKSPGWGEITFLNAAPDGNDLEKRSFLILFVFALLERQFGFAIEVARKAFHKFPDPIFKEMESYALSKMKATAWKLPLFIIKRAIEKIIS